ncbi:translation initiation factor IF-2 [Patescibacteria group bacterium]|nr:MAG: translation initiation factor IF-2 [Patescibacteria group bacterium]
MQQPEGTTKAVKIPSSVTVKRFAEILGVPVARVITELMRNKILATINEEIDFETAAIIAQDLGFVTEEDLGEQGDAMTLEKLVEICKKESESGDKLPERPAVVTILGHVDHGKTTLLDAIRKTSVAAGEAGGITQHIRAYQVKKKGKTITFVDTPGHEAFSAMRERGVSIADIAILVVAADDGVRPQTKEVIEYLKEKKIPTIVAVNKVDKPEANVPRVKQELSDNGILIEEWGGQTMSVEVSAKQNKGIDDLLERVMLLSEVENFRADTKRDGLAVVLESHLDPQKGPIATVLVKTGTLKVGQDIVAGSVFGRIKKIEDYAGKNVPMAGPSVPVSILGLGGVANVNDIVQIADRNITRAKAREGAQSGMQRRKEMIKSNSETSGEGELKKFRLIVKTDVQGSLEAIEQILGTIKSDEVVLEYVATGIGNITESDVKLAESASAKIFGFNVVATPVAKRLSEGSETEIKVYSIIYELVAKIKEEMAALLPPELVRTDFGRLAVLAIFKTGKRDMIVGGRVSEGKVMRGSLIEVKREDEIIGKGRLGNLQQNKENADEVGQGNECGLTFDGETKIKIGDTLLFYKEEEKRRAL